jgi:Mg-chelatase subunit ChlI
VQVGGEEMTLAVRLALALGTEGHRADLTTIRAACTLAALDGRTAISRQDVKGAAVLALRHRMANPLDDEELDTNKLVEQVEAAAQDAPEAPPDVAPEKKSP